MEEMQCYSSTQENADLRLTEEKEEDSYNDVARKAVLNFTISSTMKPAIRTHLPKKCSSLEFLDTLKVLGL